MEFFATMLLIGIFLLGTLVGYGRAESQWVEDCTKLKSHVTWNGKVAACDKPEEVKK